MSELTKVVVCDQYRLNRVGDGFDLKLDKADKVRTEIKTTRAYVVDCNFDAIESGILYVIHEELSIDFKNREGKYAEVLEVEAVKPKAKVKKVDSPELLEAKAEYDKVIGKAPHHKMTLESILKAIEEAN